MKRIILSLAVFLLLSSITKADEKVKIGVYDSRAIAVCYYRTADFSNKIKEIMEERKEAIEKGDEDKAKELEETGILLQRIAHDKGFGRGTVSEILENYDHDIKKIAKENDLDIIVSKWELNYSSNDIEVVDITMDMIAIFDADKKIRKMVKQMSKKEPIKDAIFLDPKL